MLLFLKVVCASFLGVEYRKHIRIIKSNSGINQSTMKVRHNGFKIENNKVKLVSNIQNDAVFDINNFLEEGYSIERLPSVKSNIESKDRKRFIDNLESPVDEVALSSLYFSKIFEQFKVDPTSSLVVSAKDYFSEEQRSKLSGIFRNIKFYPKVIPESTCAAAHLASKLNKNEKSSIYIINFAGKKTVASSYEISSGESNEKNINLKSREALDVPSDGLIEEEIYKFVSEVLRNRVFEEQVSLLPYEPRDKECFAHINNIVTEIISHLNSGIPKYTCLELYYYENSTLEKRVKVGIEFNLNDLSSRIFDLIASPIENIPENHTVYYISDFVSRKQTLLDYNPMELGAIFLGTHLLNYKNYTHNDTSKNTFSHSNDKIFNEIMLELTYKSEAVRLQEGLDSEISSLNELSSDDLAPLESFRDKKILTYKESKSFVDLIHKLRQKQKATVSQREMRNLNLKTIASAIESAENEPDEIRNLINDKIQEVKVWFEANKDAASVNDLENNTLSLKMAVNKAKMTIEKAKREKERLEAEAKKANEALEALNNENKEETPQGTEENKIPENNESNLGENAKANSSNNKDSDKLSKNEEKNSSNSKTGFEEIFKNMNKEGSAGGNFENHLSPSQIKEILDNIKRLSGNKNNKGDLPEGIEEAKSFDSGNIGDAKDNPKGNIIKEGQSKPRKERSDASVL